MKLRGIEFGHVFNAAGARNFSGKGYWYHKFLKPFGLRYGGSTLVTKTTTLPPNEGNMPIQKDGETPKEWVPRCIYIDKENELALNAVALSGPGLRFWLDKGCWQKYREHVVISFMAIAPTVSERQRERKEFVQILKGRTDQFLKKPAIQENFSCPNVGLDPQELIEEVKEADTIMEPVRLPRIAKLNAETPPAVGVQLMNETLFDALCMSNTIFFGKLPHLIDWEKYFGTADPKESPLRKRGFKQPGGLSGRPLLPIVCDWIKQAVALGIDKPIVGCGGILSKEDAGRMLDAGASAIELGSISFLHPTRIRGIIRYVNRRMQSQ